MPKAIADEYIILVRMLLIDPLTQTSFIEKL